MADPTTEQIRHAIRKARECQSPALRGTFAREARQTLTQLRGSVDRLDAELAEIERGLAQASLWGDR